MNDQLHFVSVSEEARGRIEAVGARFVREGLLKARKKSWALLEAIKPELKPGVTEDEARKLCLKIAGDFGVTKHWHRPYVRFGSGTLLTFNDPMREGRLLSNNPVYVDLGPVWADAELGLEYEGDVGDTFVVGEHAEAEKCARTARALFAEGQSAWQANECTGEELYAFLGRRAKELGYALLEDVPGHRLSDFPHHKYSQERLAAIKFMPEISLWVLEIQITKPELKIGAFYEDLLLDQEIGQETAPIASGK